MSKNSLMKLTDNLGWGRDMTSKDTIYRERANGRFEYWTYSEGRKYYISKQTALRWLNAKTAIMVYVR